MGISDEMREWADDAYIRRKIRSTKAKDIYSIADRIDAEMIELPKDRDGKPIHAGSKLFEPDGTRWEVLRIEYCDDGVDIVACSGRAQLVLEPQDYRTMAHERPDSWERIADELEKWCDSADVDGDACGEPRELADRIRRLAKEDHE